MEEKTDFRGMFPVKSHEGRILLKVAATYRSLPDALLEMVQNAIDANASRIWIEINQKTRKIIVRDNGEGVSEEKFRQALKSVGDSIKEQGKLGRFGLGLVSPLGKCESFTFTSCGGGKKFLTWTFVTKDIREIKEHLAVPCREKVGVRFDSRARLGQRGVVPWKTQITISKYTQDRQLSRIDLVAFEERIVTRFSEAMKTNQTVVDVTISDDNGKVQSREIVSKEFMGTPLEEVQYGDKNGTTSFRLYVALKQKGSRSGGVDIGETDDLFRISLKELAVSMPELCQFLPPECMEALLSGFFEGTITSSRLELLDTRVAFQANDGFVDFCSDVEIWWNQVGNNHYDQARETEREHRYVQLGRKAQAMIREILNKSDTLNVMIELAKEKIKKGTIGIDEPSSKEPLGETEQSEVALTGSKRNPDKPRDDDGKPRDRNEEPETTHPNQTPFRIKSNKKGRPRQEVRSDYKGFAFAYEEMVDSMSLWDFELKDGTIVFNIRHWLWAECEQKDRSLLRLHMIVYVAAIVWCNTQAELRDLTKSALDSLIEAYSYVLSNDERLMLLAAKFLTTMKKPNADELKVVKATPKKSSKKRVAS